MALPPVYRHDVRCPECGSNWMLKDGTSKGRLVYYCGDYGRRTTPDAAYQRPSAADEGRALAMYRDGSSLTPLPEFSGSASRRSASELKGGLPHCP